MFRPIKTLRRKSHSLVQFNINLILVIQYLIQPRNSDILRGVYNLYYKCAAFRDTMKADIYVLKNQSHKLTNKSRVLLKKLNLKRNFRQLKFKTAALLFTGRSL